MVLVSCLSAGVLCLAHRCLRTNHATLLDHGGKDWDRIYGSARNRIEEFNARLKENGLAAAGRRRLRGYTFQFILTGFLAVGQNLTELASFLDKHRPMVRPTADNPNPDYSEWFADVREPNNHGENESAQAA